jgi:hypothetical protein
MSSPISFFIVRLFLNITKEFVKDVLENKLKFGKVSKIDFSKKTDKEGRTYHSAYVYFEHFNDTVDTKTFLKQIEDPEGGRILYKKNRFWFILKNKNPFKQPKEPCIQIQQQEEPLKLILPSELEDPLSQDYYARIPEPQRDFPGIKFTLPAQTLPLKYVQELGLPCYEEEKRTVDTKGCLLDDYANMEELDEELDKVYENLVTIDSRYVRGLEEQVRRLEAMVTEACETIYRMETDIVLAKKFDISLLDV